MADTPDDLLEETLKQKADALQLLIDEAQRIHRELLTTLKRLRHAGDHADKDKRG